MKRSAVALLLHPFKNSLLTHDLLREAVGIFIETLCAIYQRFPQIRLNIIFTGYMLEAADPMLIARLRDLCKKNVIEIIGTGYTEPFISVSPPDLTMRNILQGIKVVEECTGQTPHGFFPPYSNWEPSFIARLRSAGFRYILLTNNLFSPETRFVSGYWVAEHTGSSIGLMGTHLLPVTTPEHELLGRIQALFLQNNVQTNDPCVVLHQMISLDAATINNHCSALLSFAQELEKHLLQFQPVCLNEFLGGVNPVGLQYIPASIQMQRTGAVDLHFLNNLYSFDQIGFIQRKLLDIYERLAPHLDSRAAAPLLHDLYFVQDCNRLLPDMHAGFEVSDDRLATYRRLIAVDARIRALDTHEGASVRVTDFMHSGGKTIILSNKNCKIFIDPHRGGQIVGFDFRPAEINLCGVCNPVKKSVPDIILSKTSRTFFLDRILDSREPQIDLRILGDIADFSAGVYNHKIRTNPGGITVHMVRNGAFTLDGKQMPLSLEKVFGIENDSSGISFVYQFGNPSLITAAFSFAIDLHLLLPGIAREAVTVRAGKNIRATINRQLLRLPDCTEWSFEDRYAGVRITMQTQKPVTLWYIPPSNEREALEALPITLSTDITIEPNTHYKIVGKITCKSIRRSMEMHDAV